MPLFQFTNLKWAGSLWVLDKKQKFSFWMHLPRSNFDRHFQKESIPKIRSLKIANWVLGAKSLWIGNWTVPLFQFTNLKLAGSLWVLDKKQKLSFWMHWPKSNFDRHFQKESIPKIRSLKIANWVLGAKSFWIGN